MKYSSSDSKTVLILAGEPSGDVLGGELMHSLKTIANNKKKTLKFIGIGGQNMTKQGMKSLFPISELSVMGIMEIIPKTFKLLRLISRTAQFIKKSNPDVIITIDSPDFMFRVMKRIKSIRVPKIHYVAPTVWAWRPRRAKLVANLYEHLLTLYPFENSYFPESLQCSFVGHPLFSSSPKKPDDKFYDKYDLDKQDKILCLLPGSRKSEIDNLLPIFLQVNGQLQKRLKNFKTILIPTKELKPYIHKIAKGITLIPPGDKLAAMQTSTVALAASGTVTLEIVLTELPSVITYRVHPLTAAIMRKIIKTRHVGLPNIIANSTIMPELLQSECNPQTIKNKILELLVSEPHRQEQRHKLKHIKAILKKNKEPSRTAASIVFDYL